jgi:hypothetical protein
MSVFQSYWDEATVLTEKKLEVFRRVRSQNQVPVSQDLEKALIDAFGDIAPSGIRVKAEKTSKDKLFIHEYSKTYQDFLSKYEMLRSIYKEDGRRKVTEEEVPLRLEIDQFLSFVRDKHAPSESYAEVEVLSGMVLQSRINQYLDLWHETDWQYLYNEIPVGLANIRKVFESSEAIKSATIEEIFDALTVCHSVRERLRYFKGGLPAFKSIFVKKNEPERVRELITHLLFGQNDFVERMADCIYDQNFKLKEFGRSGVQELFGWSNSEEIPICNSRTVKAMRFLGLDVKIFE